MRPLRRSSQLSSTFSRRQKFLAFQTRYTWLIINRLKQFMEQTPAHDNANLTVLEMLPSDAKKIIEIGCGSGALAREFKIINPNCNYIGIDIVQDYVNMAARYCDSTVVADIEKQDENFFEKYKDRDCWIFADSLEHLVDPWLVLDRVRQVIPDYGTIVACIPNAQNWSIVGNLAIGNFRYKDSGLLDKTHLRWFTRKTMIELFEGAGFEVESVTARIIGDPDNIPLLPIIREIAKLVGADADIASKDSIPFQYVLRVKPA